MIKNNSFRLLMIGLLALTIIAVLTAFCMGNYAISVGDVIKILFSPILKYPRTWTPMEKNVIFTLRMPRIIGAVLVGGGLALSGSSYQGVFKNPLVAPDLLGVSSGACVGAALAILLNFHAVGVQIMAFVFGIATVALTTMIPRMVRNTSMTMLVLAGVIVGGLMTSILGIIKYLADAETQLAAITYWQMGSLSKITMADVYYIAPAMVVAIIIIFCIRWQLNILSLGEAEATSLGVKISTVRGIIVICATVLTASAVCMCGTIGWVGLVIPHFSRMLVGADNVRTIPAAFFLGAVFMLVIDTVARCITTMELPLSILTGIIGAPFYFYILKRQRMKLS